MMPPPGMPAPSADAREALVVSLEAPLDRRRARRPNPGRPLVHRLNRAEYANAIRDLLALDVDAASLLPPDDSSAGFDNIADVLGVSPVLLESYLSAADRISALAIGDPKTPPMRRGLPRPAGRLAVASRRGAAARHGRRVLVERTFRSTANTSSRSELFRTNLGTMRGLEHPHQLEISVDGQRVHLASFGGDKDVIASSDNPTTTGDEIDKRFTVRVPLKAGPRRLAWRSSRRRSALQLAPPAVLHAQLRRHDRLLAGIRTSISSSSPGRSIRPASATRRAAAGSSSAARPARIRRESMRRRIFGARAARLPRRSDDARPRDAAGFLRARSRGDGPLRRRHRHGAAPDARESEVRVSRGARSRDRSGRAPSIGSRPRAGVAAVVLSVEQHPGRGAAATWRSRAACRTPAVLEQQVRRMLADPKSQALVEQLRRAVAAPSEPEEQGPELVSVSGLRRRPAAGDADRDGAVLQERHGRGSERPGPPDRRLHVRQRAAGPALRHAATSTAASSAG